MIMNEHAWTCMRMYENDSCSREGWVILGWVALYDIHDNEWECTRMTENDWERLTSNENGWGGGHSMQTYILRHAWEWMVTASDYLIMNEHVCDDTAWPCMGMYDIDSYSRWRDPLVVLQPLTGQVLHTRTQKCQHQVNMPPRDVWWNGMTMHENVWYWLMFKGCLGHLRLSRIPRHAWWMYQNDSYSEDVRVI